MNPFDNQNLFGTTANAYQDTFGNPINSANMNSGWGINPNLLTPSFQAPYRPPYVGSTGYSPFGNPSFSRSMSNMFGPSHDPYWGNPIDNIQPSVHSATTKPFDAVAWGVQNVAAPYFGYSGMAKILGPGTSNLWPGATGIAKGFGEAGGYARDLWAGRGIAAGLGRGFGTGAANTFGIGRGATWAASKLGFSAAGAAGVGASAVGFAGGMTALAAGLALPLALGEGATMAINAGMVDPYVNSRRNSDNLQRNFNNIYFGEGIGNVVSGKGLSRSASARMGIGINHQGINDMMFSSSEYSDIADMGMRSGLFDNTKGSKITQRVKDVAEQVKLLVSISNDPDIRNAIQELSRLNLAGADVTGGRTSNASRAYQQLGGFASMAGSSIRKMMDTVGAQGQYLFQSNGMTPYLGQLAAANNYAGFSAAQRSGVLSPALMARMGGLDGAAQASLTAEVMGAQTPYSMMGAYNKYIGGGSGRGVSGRNQSITGTIASFGASVSGNPMEAMGNMDLYGQAAAGADMSAQGGMGLENQATSIMQSLGIKGSGPGGAYSAGQMMSVLTKYMNIPADQARAYIVRRAGDQNSGAYNVKRSALQGYDREQSRQFVNQNMLGNGPLDSATRSIYSTGQAMTGRLAETFADPAVRAVGAVGDYATELSDRWNFGRTVGKNSGLVDNVDALLGDSGPKSVRQFRLNLSDKLRNANTGKDFKSFASKGAMSSTDAYDVLEKINTLARSSDPEASSRASRYLNASNSGERASALDQLMANDLGSLGKAKDFLSGQSSIAGRDSLNSNRSYLDQITQGLDVVSTTSSSNEASDFQKAIKNSVGKSGTGNRLADLQTIGAVVSLSQRVAKGGKGNSEEEIAAEVRANKGGQYSGILRSGGNSTKGILDAIHALNSSTISNGLEGLGSSVFGLGKSESALMGMSSSESKDAFKQVMSSRGGLVYNTKVSGSENWTTKQQADYESQALATDSLFKQEAERYRKNLTNYDDVTSKFGNIDKNTMFSMAIDKFATSIDKFANVPQGSSGGSFITINRAPSTSNTNAQDPH